VHTYTHTWTHILCTCIHTLTHTYTLSLSHTHITHTSLLTLSFWFFHSISPFPPETLQPGLSHRHGPALSLSPDAASLSLPFPFALLSPCPSTLDVPPEWVPSRVCSPLQISSLQKEFFCSSVQGGCSDRLVGITLWLGGVDGRLHTDGHHHVGVRERVYMYV